MSEYLNDYLLMWSVGSKSASALQKMVTVDDRWLTWNQEQLPEFIPMWSYPYNPRFL